MSDVRPAAVAGMFYPAAPAALAADVRAHLARALARPAATSARAQGADRAARRVRLFGPDRRRGVRASRGRARHHTACRAVRADAPRAGARARAAFGGDLRHAARNGERRSRSRGRRTGAAAGLRKRRGARVRALARGPAAFPAVGAGRLPHRPLRRRRRDAGRGRRGHRLAVGRPGDPDRRQLRPVALPPLRRGPRHRSRDRRGDTRALGHARSRAGLRGDADQRIAPGGAAPRVDAGAPRPAQFGRHGRRQVARGRLRVVRVRRAGCDRAGQVSHERSSVSAARCSRSPAPRSAPSSGSGRPPRRATRRWRSRPPRS